MKGNEDGSYDSAPGPGKSSNNVYDYNVYYGVQPAEDAHAITANPLLESPGQASNGLGSVSGYALRQHSPAADSGRTIDGNGGKDFIGTPVPQCGAVDRGAIESRQCPSNR
ncbi:MAG TPA: choice-of-anchor Q domain-containing protein [Dongiaceae bacterium]|nr:choice-of-anchor Q domain-containing protein [Dongiaceae bacterium]